MAIVYCDWATGNDTTGDGSYGNPYKTITKASTGLTGGDEVRVAKSPAHTALTGTINFLESGVITGTGTLFLSELSAGDLIEDSEGAWCEVISITDDTNASLYKRLRMPEYLGVSSRKLGYTDTGEALSTANVQEVSSFGTISQRLKISGGWNLSTQLRDGETWFRQMHTTFNNRYGIGLNLPSGADYVEVDGLGFLRYSTGVYLRSTVSHCYLKDITCCSMSAYSMVLYDYNYGNYIENLVSCSCNGRGIRFWGYCNANYVKSSYYYDNNYDVSMSSADDNNMFGEIKSIGNYAYGIYTEWCRSNVFKTLIYECRNDEAISLYSSEDMVFQNVTISEPWWGSSVDPSINLYSSSAKIHNLSISGGGKIGAYNGGILKIGKGAFDFEDILYDTEEGVGLYINNLDGNVMNYLNGGTIYTQVATAGGSGIEWVLHPDSVKAGEYFPLSLKIALIAVEENEEVTVTLYFKKSHATNIGGALAIRGYQIAGVDDDIIDICPNDTSRNQLSIQFTPTENGVVEIEAWAWYIADAGTVIVDDIEVSQ